MNLTRKKSIEKELLSNSQKSLKLDLSQERLSVADYEWLANIIKNSSTIEKLLLPRPPIQGATQIFSILDRITVKNSTLTDINIDLSRLKKMKDDKIEIIKVCHHKIQNRLERNKKRIFAIHGGGNIGIGLLADVISKSPFQYNIVATSDNPLRSDLINILGKTWLKHHDGTSTCINNIKMISRDRNKIIDLYSTASLAAICVTPSVLMLISPDIAHGLLTRYEQDGGGLKILILMNLPKCHEFVYEKIYAALRAITDEEIALKIMNNVEFIPTVIDRIVTPIKNEEIKLQHKTQLAHRVMEKKSNTTLEKSHYIESMLFSNDKLLYMTKKFKPKVNLFNAEKDFTICISESFHEARRFPLMRITKNLEQFETLKNKFINGPHAVLAWMGGLFGFQSIADAIKHPFIFNFIHELMEKEIAPILQLEYPTIPKNEFHFLKENFFKRCNLSTEDTVFRVGRDPLRKLNRGANIRGTLEIASKHNFNIATPRLEFGVASGIVYAVKGITSEDADCNKIFNIFQTKKNYQDILIFEGIAPSGTFIGFDLINDKILLNNILNKIHFLEKLYENNKQILFSKANNVSFFVKGNTGSQSLKNHSKSSIGKII